MSIVSIINPLKGVPESAPVSQQATAQLSVIFKDRLELAGGEQELVEAKVSRAAKPTITLTAKEHDGIDWSNRAVQVIRKEGETWTFVGCPDEPNDALQKWSEELFRSLGRVEEATGLPSVPEIIAKEAPPVFEAIRAMKEELHLLRGVAAEKEAMAREMGELEEQLGALRGQSAEICRLQEALRKKEEEKSAIRDFSVQFQRMMGRLERLLRDSHWECSKQQLSSLWFNLICLTTKDLSIPLDPKWVQQQLTLFYKQFGIQEEVKDDVVKALVRKHRDKILPLLAGFGRPDRLNRVAINRVLESIRLKHTRLLEKMQRCEFSSVEEIFVSFPAIVGEIIVLRHQFDELEKMYMSLRADGKADESRERRFVNHHIMETMVIVPIFDRIIDLFQTLLNRAVPARS